MTETALHYGARIFYHSLYLTQLNHLSPRHFRQLNLLRCTIFTCPRGTLPAPTHFKPSLSRLYRPSANIFLSKSLQSILMTLIPDAQSPVVTLSLCYAGQPLSFRAPVAPRRVVVAALCRTAPCRPEVLLNTDVSLSRHYTAQHPALLRILHFKTL